MPTTSIVCDWSTKITKLPPSTIFNWDPPFSQPFCLFRLCPCRVGGIWKNGGFTLKMHQMFSVHTTLEEFENTTITGRFGLVFEETWGREITWLSWRHRFQKATFSKRFWFTGKRTTGISEFLWFEQYLRKLRSPDTSVWTVGLTVEIKRRFQISIA